ncbi:hypothetical protein GDO81_017180 [Engystomops pustulosus]|nr:hypothetical protein GDO81_017180 [Engystomops pustulosus]
MIVVLSEMEKKRLVSEDNLQSFKAYLENIKRADLCETIEKFEKKQYQRQDRRLDLDAKLANISIQEESDADVSQPGMQNDPPLKDDQSETYKLNKCPHGWCIIVNNHDFNEARSKKIEMNDRNGTHKDAEKIKEIFHSRGYEVKNHDNVTSSKMLEIMENYAKWDHSESDSFVCFVLSHGDKGTVFGTDGKDVKVKDLTDHFNGLNSPSLVGKPKVFFIQACQGGNSDTGVPYVSDRNPTEYINDSAGNKLPITADFLTAFASVEDYESLRNIYTGSVYIQSLCKFLQDPQFLETDLTRILTKVHKKVSDEVYSIHKNGRMQSVMQMPTYKSELRKTLILPPPFIGQQESRLCHQ